MTHGPQPFDPLRILRALNDAGVRYIVIGAFAGRLLGSPTVTRDLDICYARERTNLERLAGVLQRFQARLRGVDEGLPFRLDARALAAGDSFTFATDAGDVDILGTPSGTGGYDDLIGAASPTDLDGLVVQVVSLDDLIRMKRAAGRPKDLIEVEVLAALRDELDQLEQDAAESIRRDMLAERQARLDEALALDAKDDLAFARASGAVAARTLARDVR